MARSELLPANPDILEGVDDLIKFSYLNEPSILHNLKFRYSKEMIYVCILLWIFLLLRRSTICSHMLLVLSVCRVKQGPF